MSLKGPNIIFQTIYDKQKRDWELEYSYELKDGRAPDLPESELFAQFLCRRLMKTKSQLSQQEALVKRRTRERNLALALCAVLLIAVLSLVPAQVRTTAGDATETAAVSASVQPSRRMERNYVASVNSDKYHRLSCDYAGNILEENRVYYATAGQAEAAGKEPCSVCRP